MKLGVTYTTSALATSVTPTASETADPGIVRAPLEVFLGGWLKWLGWAILKF